MIEGLCQVLVARKSSNRLNGGQNTPPFFLHYTLLDALPGAYTQRTPV